MSFEHSVEKPIRQITIGAEEQASYTVGRNGVTKIEATTKSGMHADIPYVRVWAGENALAEFCQHNLTGVYFE